MKNLQFRLLTKSEIDPKLQREIDALDHLAFAGDSIDDDPVFSMITWAPHDWSALGFLNGKLITQAGFVKREIKVGTEKVWVAGLGGMATHPEFQRQGYGSTLLEASAFFMRDQIRVPFGLLICADSTRPFYERADWQTAADHLYFTQEDQRHKLDTCVMIIPLMEERWHTGEIDLCGLPW